MLNQVSLLTAGCVHIILTVLVRGEPAKWNIENLARRLLSCGRYWRRLQMLIQLPGSALLLKNGVVQRTWEAAKLQVGFCTGCAVCIAAPGGGPCC